MIGAIFIVLIVVLSLAQYNDIDFFYHFHWKFFDISNAFISIRIGDYIYKMLKTNSLKF